MRPRPKDVPNAIWHATGRVNWRTWYLQDRAAYEVFMRHLRVCLERFGVDLIAYVLMSNHYHLVARTPDDDVFRSLTSRRLRCGHLRPYPKTNFKRYVISQFMHRLKLGVAKELQSVLGLVGHLWQGEHHRRRLADAWDLVVAVAYDHRNPVRAGMVGRPEFFARSSAMAWAGLSEPDAALAVRRDFPFGLTHEQFSECVLAFQQSKRLDDVMEVFAKSGLRPDSPEGRAHLRSLMDAAGLDPLGRCSGP